MKRARTVLAAGCLLPTACSTPGGGPLGFVLFDRYQHVASAAPLFGKNDDRCLDNPTFLLTMFARDSENVTIGQDGTIRNQAGAVIKPDICTQIRWALAWGLRSHGKTAINYDMVTRNEVVGAMMAASDRKCGLYTAYLQQYNANVKGGFGIIDTAASTLANVASGGIERALTATSTIAGHTRSELDEAHFANQAIGVLTQAFRSVRQTQRREIYGRLAQEGVLTYPLTEAMADVFRYHGNCSIVVGLEQAQQAVSEKQVKDNGTSSTDTATPTPAPAASTPTPPPAGNTPPPKTGAGAKKKKKK